MIGGTGHWPVAVGYQPTAQPAASPHHLVREFPWRNSAAGCRRERPSWPFHPDSIESFGPFSAPGATAIRTRLRGPAPVGGSRPPRALGGWEYFPRVAV